MNNPAHKVIVQSIGKAAAKTFLQAFLGIMALIVVPHLGTWVTDVQSGGTVDVDLKWWANALLAATGAGIAALISVAWNWSKGPTSQQPIVVAPPVVVDK